MKDYYQVLQVDPRAEPEVIESAYQGLSRKYHPDVNASPEAAERMLELNEAYEVLSDPVKRAEYDEWRGGPEAEWAAPEASTVDEEPVGPAVDDSAAAAAGAAAAADDGVASAPQVSAGFSGGLLGWAQQQAVALRLPTSITVTQVLLIALLTAALFTRFWRLDTPGDKMFDEIYFATTAQEILHWDPAAWEFYGHENTHPPLSKLIMAGGMGIFGENSFGWRFFGALAGVGSVVFIYLLGRRLFRSETVGMIAAFLMTFEGLAFTQARIATPDAYVLFFVLGATYFLVSGRSLLSGVFLGAALASKWTALFAVFPIVLYLLYRHWRTGAVKDARLLYLAPLALLALYMGTPVVFGGLLVDEVQPGVLQPDFSKEVFRTGLASWMLFWTLAPALIYFVYRRLRAGRGGEGNAAATSMLTLPLFFVVVPLYVYFLTYLPMLLNGHSFGDVAELNRAAYQFHSTLEATHPYQAPWDTWPILQRPVYFYLDPVDEAKIYNLGNPLIFWFGLPALAFALWQGLKYVRARVDAATGGLRVWGSLGPREAALLFVVLTYLAFWLPWAAQPRIMFLYHYLNALSFLILALAYGLWRLWEERIWDRVSPLAAALIATAGAFLLVGIVGLTDDPRPLWARPFLAIGAAILGTTVLTNVLEKRWQLPGGRVAAVAFLAAVAVTFVYFYPRLASVDVSRALDESYYWFKSWR